MAHGCHNREPYLQSLPATDSIRIKGLSVTHGRVQIPFRMAKDCQYTKSDLGQLDKDCYGCKWRLDPQDKFCNVMNFCTGEMGKPTTGPTYANN
jgi:hypothetical protein